MLYTNQLENGEYAYPFAQLPFRITLSNGLSRTDPSTFTDEEIADAGFSEVLDPPDGLAPWEKASWDAEVGDWRVDQYEPPEPTPAPEPTAEDVKCKAMAILAVDGNGNAVKLDSKGISAIMELMPGVYVVGLYPELSGLYLPEITTRGLRSDYEDVTSSGFTLLFFDAQDELVRPVGNITIKVQQ